MEMADGIGRSKDGVPQWSGEAASFQDYEDQCLQWEQSIAYNKRYLAAPRLIGELSGTARKYVAGKRPDWVSFPGGVSHLMQHLRRSLGKPQIPELSEHLNRFFKNSRRRKFETMNDYIVRKTEVYSRAKQALARVKPHYTKSRSQRWEPTSSWWDQQGAGWQTWGNTWWEQPSSDDEAEGNEDGNSTRSQADAPPQSAEETGSQRQEEDPWMANQSSYGGWSRSGWGTHTEDEWWMTDTDELLPDYLQGWYLLADANLDGPARNLVQTALRNNFSLSKVAQELRNQWPDDEIKRYDQGHKQAGFWSADYEDEDDEEHQAHLTMASLIQEGMNEEGLSLVAEAEEEAEEAMALIHQAKKTLREARAKQHQVKLSRKYYQVSTTDKTKSKGKITCFRCGGDHKVAQCPDRHAPKKEHGNVTTEEAPFVCFSEVEEGMMAQGAGKLTTEEAIRQGYGIIDGGATKTLGSLHALGAIADENLRKHNEDRVIEVNTKERPVFGFGNSSRDQCVSTAKMKIEAGPKAGVLTVHALEKGQGPVLLSIDTLRKLGAIIDFAEDLVVFRNLDDKKLIQAQQSQVGHQLLPLTENLYSQALDSTCPIPSLRSFCQG